jgi:hypothetical protein
LQKGGKDKEGGKKKKGKKGAGSDDEEKPKKRYIIADDDDMPDGAAGMSLSLCIEVKHSTCPGVVVAASDEEKEAAEVADSLANVDLSTPLRDDEHLPTHEHRKVGGGGGKGRGKGRARVLGGGDAAPAAAGAGDADAGDDKKKKVC